METLTDKFEKAIIESDLYPMTVATQNSERLAIECNKIAIQSQMELLKEIQAVLFLKGQSSPEIYLKIKDLESQLNKE